jgi:hypothetical protein
MTSAGWLLRPDHYLMNCHQSLMRCLAKCLFSDSESELRPWVFEGFLRERLDFVYPSCNHGTARRASKWTSCTRSSTTAACLPKHRLPLPQHPSHRRRRPTYTAAAVNRWMCPASSPSACPTWRTGTHRVPRQTLVARRTHARRPAVRRHARLPMARTLAVTAPALVRHQHARRPISRATPGELDLEFDTADLLFATLKRVRSLCVGLLRKASLL